MQIVLWYLAALVASYVATWALQSSLIFVAVLFLGPPVIVLVLVVRWGLEPIQIGSESDILPIDLMRRKRPLTCDLPR
jgi:hypothetical protein